MNKLKVTNDYVFKRIFGKQGNEKILKDLLISILDIPIKEIEVIHDSQLERTIKDNKVGISSISSCRSSKLITPDIARSISLLSHSVPFARDPKRITSLAL